MSAARTFKSLMLLTTIVSASAGYVEVVDHSGEIDPLEALKKGTPIQMSDESWKNDLSNYFIAWLSDPKNIAGVDLSSKELAVELLFYRSFQASEYKKEGARHIGFHLSRVESFRKQLAPRELVPMSSLSDEEREFHYQRGKPRKRGIQNKKPSKWFEDEAGVKEVFIYAFNFCAHANLASACNDAAALVSVDPEKGQEGNFISSLDGSKERAATMKSLLTQKALLQQSMFGDADKLEKAGQKQETRHRADQLNFTKGNVKRR